jgi:hypothetical protein
VAAFIREGLTVAQPSRGIKKKKGRVMARPPGGIKKKKGSDEITVPEFSMPDSAVDGIAQVIVNAWNGDASLNKIMDRITSGPKKGMATQDAVTQATAAINAAAPNYNLRRAVIISEKEHDDGYTMEDENDVVFVLPNKGRIVSTGGNLLNTAKLLMACTPNGI